MPQPQAQSPPHTVVDTLQSLIVAFVLAMIFRGFVTEGFVIPTGSMAPTLLGEHLAMRGDQSGIDYDVGFAPSRHQQGLGQRLDRTADPMLGRDHPGTGSTLKRARARMGDRILVLKALYPFFEPDRFDVVVFKNPTSPNGDAGNYIKRLIGLPGEALWLVDGDVFTAPAAAIDDHAAFHVRRKPDYIQRAVWQPVYDSDFPPVDPLSLSTPWLEPWVGPGWTRNDTVYDCAIADATTLDWDVKRSPFIDDWTPYNMLENWGIQQDPVLVHDLRIAATVTAKAKGLTAGVDLIVRGHLFRFSIGEGAATITVAPVGREPDEGITITAASGRADFPSGKPVNVEFWHVDQRAAIYIDGRLVVEQEYDWAPAVRLTHAIGYEDDVRALAAERPTAPAEISITSAGAALTLTRLRIDRDLHYRLDHMRSGDNPPVSGFEDPVKEGAFGLATHPESIVRLGPDQFFMLGDNSAASKDSRTWGSPHPMIASLLDPTPGVVPRELMLGKAWLVYFPSPLPLTEGGRALIPNFGALRFIR